MILRLKLCSSLAYSTDGASTEYLWFGLHCLIYSLSSIIYRALIASSAFLMCLAFRPPSAVAPSFSRASLPLIPPYAAAPGFITPSARYEPNRSNVAAPHLIGRLISERTRALIKSKPKSNGSGGHKDGQEDMCRHTRARLGCACSLFTAVKQLQNSHALGGPRSSFISGSLITTHVSHCFHNIDASS